MLQAQLKFLMTSDNLFGSHFDNVREILIHFGKFGESPSVDIEAPYAISFHLVEQRQGNRHRMIVHDATLWKNCICASMQWPMKN